MIPRSMHSALPVDVGRARVRLFREVKGDRGTSVVLARPPVPRSHSPAAGSPREPFGVPAASQSRDPQVTKPPPSRLRLASRPPKGPAGGARSVFCGSASVLAFVGLAVVSFAPIGCGGAAAPPAQLPSTVADATAEVDRAEASLAHLLPGPRGAPSAEQAVPQVDSGQKTPAPQQPPAPPTRSEAEAAGEPESQCKSACDALTSLLRAVDHLCALTGDDDSRCVSAQSRAQRAKVRVSEGCSECAP